MAHPLRRIRHRRSWRRAAPRQDAEDRRFGDPRRHPGQRRGSPGRTGDLPLVSQDHGRTPSGLLLLGTPDLAALENPTASDRDVKVLHRPATGSETARRGGPAPVPTGERGGGEHW